MALNFLPVTADGLHLHPVESPHTWIFCFALLSISCALASFAFACATPFAAFAVVAGAMLPLRPALLVIAGAWLVNQAIGFAFLHYPVSVSTIAWGFVIGAATLAATVASAAVLRALAPHNMLLALVLGLVCGYGVYELVLFAATPVLGGAGAFTRAIVVRLGLLNIVWLIGLVIACEIARLLHPFRRDRTVST
jgi:hypothetical protein